MKQFKTKPKYVTACQFDGTLSSLRPLKEVANKGDITNDMESVYFRCIQLQAGCWIVKNEYDEFVVMRDNMFKASYEDIK